MQAPSFNLSPLSQLLIAALNDNTKAMKEAIKRGAAINGTIDSNELDRIYVTVTDSILSVAPPETKGAISLTEYLLYQEATPSHKNKNDDKKYLTGATPLYIAIKFYKNAAANLLLAQTGIAIDTKHFPHESPLLTCAAESGNSISLISLLKHPNITSINHKNLNHETALLAAARGLTRTESKDINTIQNYIFILQELLSKETLYVNALNNDEKKASALLREFVQQHPNFPQKYVINQINDIIKSLEQKERQQQPEKEVLAVDNYITRILGKAASERHNSRERFPHLVKIFFESLGRDKNTIRQRNMFHHLPATILGEIASYFTESDWEKLYNGIPRTNETNEATPSSSALTQTKKPEQGSGETGVYQAILAIMIYLFPHRREQLLYTKERIEKPKESNTKKLTRSQSFSTDFKPSTGKSFVQEANKKSTASKSDPTIGTSNEFMNMYKKIKGKQQPHEDPGSKKTQPSPPHSTKFRPSTIGHTGITKYPSSSGNKGSSVVARFT